jgi:TonB family protein
VTLTNDDSATALSAVQSEPGGNGHARVSEASSGSGSPGTPAGSTAPATVALRDLSRRPVPPELDAVLRRNYPAQARRNYVTGTAIVRARIDADGRVRSSTIVSQTQPGFGAACQKTVLGSVWSPPLDGRGHPVATHVSYTCRFQVDE